MTRLSRAVVAALVVVSGFAVTTATSAPAAAQTEENTFKVIDRVRLFDGAPTAGRHPTDGWLVINPGTRRGYQIFRPNIGDTIIASFDLDTLQHKRTITLPGVGIAGACPSPPCSTVGSPNAPGDVVWAVDEVGGKLFLAGATKTPTINGGSTDLARSFTIVQIDEARFDAGAPIDGPTGFLRHLRIPATQTAELVGRDIYGLEFVRQGSAGKLIGLFSTPPGTVTRQAHDHWLAQWDVSSGFGDWTYLLTGCARAVLNASAAWTFQIPILKGEKYIYLGCQATHGLAAAVRIPLDGGGNPEPDVTLQQTFQLPRTHANVLADPVSERLLFQTDLRGSTWFVFDGPSGSWVGSVGSSLWSGYPITAGIDKSSGRLYTLVPDHTKGTNPVLSVSGGFGFSDIRITPAPQTRYVLPELDYPGQFKMLVDPAAEGRDRRIFLRRGSNILGVTPNAPGTQNDQPRPVENEILVIRDREPVLQPVEFDRSDLTIDRDEEEDVTQTSYTGVANGFGTRVLLIGGATAAVPNRQLDEDMFTNGIGNPPVVPPLITSCYRNDRELVFGTGQTKVTDVTADGQAVALVADESTKKDLGEPAGRCPAPGTQLVPDTPPEVVTAVPPVVDVPEDNQQFLAKLIDSRVGQQWDSNGDKKDDYTTSCAGDESPDSVHFEKDHQEYDSYVDCDQTGAKAEASSSAAVVPEADVPIRIAHSSVDAKVYRDPVEGIVGTVTSTVRGLEIAGVGTIGLIQAKATSYAKGRPGTADKRGARTEYERTFCGIDLPTLKHRACGDPKQVAEALNRALGKYGEVRLRDPDPDYKKGASSGYQSAIQRDRRQAFTDQFVSRDASNTVPALEIILWANDSATMGAGRQIFQFAGVEASSTYSIKCLRGIRPDGKDCKDAPGTEPANLRLALQDGFEKPLEGGVFKVHKDVDGDGTLGVDDPVMSNGTCMTAADGVGNCSWEGIPPGDYVIEQTTAPAGYDAVDDFALNLPSGNQLTVTFTNLRAVAGVLLGLVDGDSGEALAGGEFELYQDNGDGTVSGADKLYATCKSDATGLCQFELPAGSPAAAAAEDPKLPCFGQTEGANEEGLEEDLTGALEGQLDSALTDPTAADKICVAEVPLGAYVVHQKTAPADYDAAEDLPVKFELPGQVALLVFANGLAAIPGTAGSEATPADPGEAPREIPPVESTIVEPGSANPQPIVQTTPIQKGGGPLQRALERIVSAPASAIRWLFSNPRELGLMVAVWTLIWLPCYLAERRRVLRALRDPSTSSIGATVA